MVKTTTGQHLSIDLDEDEVAGQSSAGAVVVIDEDTETVAEIIDEDGDPRDKLPDRARQNRDGSVTLPLLYPQTLTTRKDGTVREKHYSELTFHRLRGVDQQVIASVPDEKQIAASFARSTRLPQMVMDALYAKMDLEDIADGGRVLNHFLTSGRKTGRS